MAKITQAGDWMARVLKGYNSPLVFNFTECKIMIEVIPHWHSTSLLYCENISIWLIIWRETFIQIYYFKVILNDLIRLTISIYKFIKFWNDVRVRLLWCTYNLIWGLASTPEQMNHNVLSSAKKIITLLSTTEDIPD